jgi:hypothetical protein
MPVIYVARSKTLSDWGASVGISKNLFKVGVAVGSGKEAVAALNEEACVGATDWTLVKATDMGEASEAEALERLSKKEMVVDPRYYPRLKGAAGIFRVKLENVENSLLVEKALAGEESLTFKIKPADVASYLIKNARG